MPSLSHDPLRILFIAAEAAPLIKVGGLGDVAGSLPLALRALPPEELGGRSLDVRLVIPFHPMMRSRLNTASLVASFAVPATSGPIAASVYQTNVDNMPVYLIAGAPVDQETSVYNFETSKDGEKYTFVALAALQLAEKLGWQPDIVHVNDWHTAVAAYVLAQRRRQETFFAETRTVLSVHNLPFMGAGAEPALQTFGISPTQDERLPVWARQMPLPLGLQSADIIIAVSPSYAQEILTPAFGCDLQDFLKTRADRITGILNGLDNAAWNPATDPALAARFDRDHLEARHENKRALLAEFSLDPQAVFGRPAEDVPLIILISRMDQQKGVDVAVQALSQMAGEQWFAILLGNGDPVLEGQCRQLEADLPNRVRAAMRFDVALSRRMYAGGDLLIMPSRYEPCGLAQMIAMRYGCVPVASAVGGLRDTIQNVVIRPSRTPRPVGTGFLFKRPARQSLQKALQRALALYPQRDIWQSIQRQGMQLDFSWPRFALEYAKIYINLREQKS